MRSPSLCANADARQGYIDEVDPSPPIVFVDEGGGVGPLFESVDSLIEYLEWPDQYDGEPAHGYDSRGRRLTLLAESSTGSVAVSISPEADAEALETLLRPIVRERTVKYGLLDADVELDTLLRALWPHMRWGNGAYPGG